MSEVVTKEYTEEDIKKAVKPLSQNAFARVFQRAYLKWLGAWYVFADKREKLSAWLYRIGFFLVFSIGVTLWQYIVMTFLPYAFKSLNGGAAGWPAAEVGSTGQRYIIFGDGNGWGYFIAFEIAVFSAQCINFPLQRNITYRSHGNVFAQAAWYLLGWVLVSVFTSAVWGIINVYLLYWGCPDAVAGIVKTLITGVVSLVIFFFIFLIIFPDNAAMAKKAKAKYEKLLRGGAAEQKRQAALLRAQLWERRATLSAAEKDFAKSRSLAGATAVKYFAFAKKAEEAKTEGERADFTAKKQTAFLEAVEALKLREEKEKIFISVKSL